MSEFAFKLVTDVRFGAGRAARLGDDLAERGFLRVALVVDAGVAAAAARARASIEAACTEVAYRESDATEPTYDYLDAFRQGFPDGLDAVVGIGGGSTLDVAKAVAALLTNDGPAITYRGFDLVKVASLPIVAVPTTAGTGSEVTPYAVFTDTSEGRKLGINTEYNRPALAVLDPLLTVGCPPGPTLSAGLDAMVHALEGFAARGASPLSRLLSREGAALVHRNLPRVMDDPGDVDARGAMLYAALLSGAGLMNAGAGPAGAMSYPLGVRFGVPHGLAGGVLLAAVACRNASRGYEGYADLAAAIGLTVGDDASRRFAEELRAWTERLGVPRLGSLGVGAHDVEMLVAETFDGLLGAIRQNPVQFEPDDARAVLTDLLH